eukprot:Protomagalhaensia_wolfi_Nauph_80__486@NODE_1274_length_1616_cov_14_228916_g983_i0_p1_GENE_NODE_1274_length_1616_cov_14_228916_g983_i0NODE_1274_length_1616_cov_14_228916_g983_i0_p1_ORF_typecomplete_len470_score77_59GpcrRhopsn4/PF10192_9/9_8e33_NODE_1274_length_1616_cov_14_228916_g983_i01261535
MGVRWLLALLVICWVNLVAEGKIVSGSFLASPIEKNERVHYMTQFACDIGECKYRVRAGIRHPMALVAWATSKLSNRANKFRDIHDALAKAPPAKLTIRVVLDDEWETSHNLPACQRAELGRGRTTVAMPFNGTYGDWVTNTFRQTYRPHFWYFFAEDCRNGIVDQLTRLTGAKAEDFKDFEIFYEIDITQVDGSHLSFEHCGMIKWNLIQLTANVAIFAYLFAKQKKVMKGQRFQLHLMSQLLNASLIVSVLGNILQIFFLGRLGASGRRLPFLEGSGETMFILSQIAISSCLIMIALGVTLNAPEKLPLPLCYLLAAAISFAHIAVVITEKYLADPRFKYYGNEGPVGWILLVFRLSLFGLFIACWQWTRSDPKTPAPTERFLRRMLVPACAYFLTFPMLLLLTHLCKPYWRHAFFFHSSFMLHLVAVVWLSEVFLSKGEYFKVSQMSQSFLPGGVWRPTVGVHHID